MRGKSPPALIGKPLKNGLRQRAVLGFSSKMRTDRLCLSVPLYGGAPTYTSSISETEDCSRIFSLTLSMQATTSSFGIVQKSETR